MRPFVVSLVSIALLSGAFAAAQTPAASYTLRGQAESGSRIPEGAFLQVTAKGPSTLLNALRALVRADGSFEFADLAPGAYTLIAYPPAEAFTMDLLTGRDVMGRIDFTVTDHDIDGLVFHVSLSTPLRGIVSFAKGAPTVPLNATLRLISLEPQMGFEGIGPHTNIKTAGAFALRGLAPVRYGIAADRLPPGYFIQSARLGPLDVLASGLHFANGVGGTLEVVLSNQGPAARSPDSNNP